MNPLVRVEPDPSGVSRVVLQCAERRNALSIELLEQLCDTVDSLARDSSNRVIILTGDGPVFSAGLDLREAADSSLVEHSAGCVERALRTLRSTPLIVVAAVRGGAYAGGAGLMAACDIVVAADDAKIGFPEARRGLLPALIFEVIQARVRDGDLRDLFLCGQPVSAIRAQQMGLVQRIVPLGHLDEEALSVAEAIIAGGPETIRSTKRLINASSVAHAASIEDHLAARNSDEAREGMAAFVEKRKPSWFCGEEE